MSINDIRDEYKDQTRQLSNVARQLAFAAGAIIWLFRGKESLILSGALLYAMFFLILFFILDLLQYIFASWKLKGTIDQYRKESKDEKKAVDGKPYEKDEKDLLWTKTAFKCKIFFLAVSYFILIGYYAILIFDAHVISLIRDKFF